MVCLVLVGLCCVSGFLVSLHEGSAGRCVVVVLEGLQRAHSLSHLLGDLCEALENRGSVYSLSLNHGETHPYRCSRAGTVSVPEIAFQFNSFLMGRSRWALLFPWREFFDWHTGQASPTGCWATITATLPLGSAALGHRAPQWHAGTSSTQKTPPQGQSLLIINKLRGRPPE